MNKIFFLLFAFAFALQGMGQPVLNSKEVIEGIAIYKDYTKPGLYYYGPGKLLLAKAKAQRPDFQLTQMRYTGTACSGDQGENHFLNLVQFTLEMESIEPEIFDKLMAHLKQKTRKPMRLVSMPMRYIETFILLPVASNQPPQRVEAEGVANFDPQEGSFWRRKNFNFRLTNAESQLLSQQMKGNHLSISVGYGFYADAVLGTDGQMTLSGTKKDVEDLLESNNWEDLLAGDTLAIPRIFHAGTTTFDLDLARHPDLIKQIDINEGLPPDYPALEVRCYDFRDKLRPDLAIKQVEIAGVGVGGKPLSPQAVRFNQRAPYEYAKNFRFPFAVKMGEDVQYRITSYSLKGKREATEWISRPICDGLLDLTTSPEENPLQQVSVAFETDQPMMDSAACKKVEILIAYELAGQAHLQQLELESANGLYAELNVAADKDSRIWYVARWLGSDETSIVSRPKEVIDGYYFLKIE